MKWRARMAPGASLAGPGYGEPLNAGGEGRRVGWMRWAEAMELLAPGLVSGLPMWWISDSVLE